MSDQARFHSEPAMPERLAPEPPLPEPLAPEPRAGTGPIGRVLALPFIGLIWVYRITLSPLIGRQCRFSPTCSVYGMEAFRSFGPITGGRLTLVRVLRCHPLSKRPVYDPVPTVRRDAPREDS